MYSVETSMGCGVKHCILYTFICACSGRHLHMHKNPVHGTLDIHYHLAVITCVRDRSLHLDIFESYLAGKLKDIPYVLIVVEQNAGAPFNRGWLMNVGFAFMMNNSYTRTVKTVIFHDVDMLANSKVKIDVFLHEVVHLSTSASQFEFKMPYESYLSGIVAFQPAFYKKMNGYSNKFWGWGGEDDDLARRVQNSNVKVHRPFSGNVLSMSDAHTYRENKNHASNVRILNEPIDPNDGVSNWNLMGEIQDVQRHYNEWIIHARTFRKD